MVRCPRCGLRLRDSEPVCPSHGAPPGDPVTSVGDGTAGDEEAALASALEARGYKVERLLGRGGFGAVYGATRTGDGLRVAVKVALPEQPAAVACLEREAIALETVGPPSAPIVHERGTVAGRYFVALEYIDAPTLADRLVSAAGPMPVEQFATCAAAVLRAVRAIHTRGIIHRDLKPENVFLVAGGPPAAAEATSELIAKIIDFGNAKVASSPRRSAGTAQEEAMGTAEYMSPEQCDGLPDTDQRSDVYSVGILLYEMLAGAPPFWGRAADVREAQRSRRPPPLSASLRCPAQLEEVIRRCLAKERARRFDGIVALEQAFDGAVDAAFARPTPPSKASPAGQVAAAPTAATREKRTMGLLFFDSHASLPSIQSLLTSSGGQLVQTTGRQYVAAFGHDAGDNPARTAIVAGQRMLSSGLCERLLVDVAAVSVQLRPNGTSRIFSPVFSKKDQFPDAADPAGLSLTAAALDVVSGLPVAPIPNRAGRFRLVLERSEADDATKFGTTGGVTVGREEVLAQLVEDARGALGRSEPTLATVVGEVGYGKTHLAGVIAQRVGCAVPGCEVIRWTAQESMLGAQSQTLPDLLRRLLDGRTEAPQDGGRSLWMSRLGDAVGEQVWAAASLSLGWISADHPDLKRLAAAPGALRLATSRAVGEELRRRAVVRRLVLVLDDAHLADDAMLDALEYATLREAGGRICVYAMVGPGFQRGRPMWATRAAHGPTRVLTQLEQSDAIDLARALLQVEQVPTVALARLAERTQGVPRLLVELVRGLKREGLVRRSERGTGYYLATDELEKLPDLPIVQWNARREVETLPAQLVGHARLASVLGGRFTVAEVEGLIQILEKQEPLEDVQLDANVGLQRLVDARLLVRHRSGLIDFRNALMRDTIYELLPSDRRQRFHRAAFEMYRDANGLAEGQRLPRLALHAARSGAKEEAARAYLELAELAVQTHGYLEAEMAFGSALENLSGADDPRTIQAARGRGLMRFRLGRHEDALTDLMDAGARAQARAAVDERIEILLDEATVLDWTRDYTLSADRLKEAEGLARMPSALTAARIGMARSRTHYRELNPQACADVGTEAARMAECLGGPGYETMVIALLMAAPSYALLGRLDEAERCFERALAAAESRSDMQHVASALNNRIFLWFARKDVDKLFADLTAVTRIAREIGASILECNAVQNTAEVEYVVEALEKATEHARRAVEIATQLWGEQSAEVSGRELLLARIALYQGDRTEAHRLAERIHARSSSGAPGAELSATDAAMLAMVDLGTREATEQEWDELLARAGTIGLQPLEDVEMLEASALASERAGHLEEARIRLGRALDVCAAKPNLMSHRVERRYKAM